MGQYLRHALAGGYHQGLQGAVAGNLVAEDLFGLEFCRSDVVAGFIAGYELAPGHGGAGAKAWGVL